MPMTCSLIERGFPSSLFNGGKIMLYSRLFYFIRNYKGILKILLKGPETDSVVVATIFLKYFPVYHI